MKKQMNLTVSIRRGIFEGTGLGIGLMFVIALMAMLIGIPVINDIQERGNIFFDDLVGVYGLYGIAVFLVFPLAVLIVMAFLHELGHYIVYAFTADDKEGLRMGLRKIILPYTACPKGQLTIRDKIIELLCPFMFSAFLALLALVLQHGLGVFIWGIALSFCGEDILCALRVFRYRKLKNAYCVDHPERMGCILFYEEDEEEETDEDEKKSQ